MPLNGSQKITLLSAADETGSAVMVFPGTYNWYVYDTWDGATAQLQFSPDEGSTWIDIDGLALTADGGWTGIELAAGHVRVEISDAGASTSLSSDLRGVA